ncbi:MAG TPA: hypothetical protein V6D37_02905 [Candidatus Sericytochromatia bacterium]
MPTPTQGKAILLGVAIAIISFTSLNGEPFRILVRGNLNPMTQTVTLQIPERLYHRLVNTTRATNSPLEEVMLHALKVGSPPNWDNVPMPNEQNGQHYEPRRLLYAAEGTSSSIT